MRLDALLRVLFTFYCVEAGILLALVPWTGAWDRIWILIPVTWARQALFSPWGRGAVSGFGLVHLVWSVHEIGDWLHARHSRPDPTI